MGINDITFWNVNSRKLESNCLCINLYEIWLRGDFLEYQVIRAQNYCHSLRENGAICCFWLNANLIWWITSSIFQRQAVGLQDKYKKWILQSRSNKSGTFGAWRSDFPQKRLFLLWAQAKKGWYLAIKLMLWLMLFWHWIALLRAKISPWQQYYLTALCCYPKTRSTSHFYVYSFVRLFWG